MDDGEINYYGDKKNIIIMEIYISMAILSYVSLIYWQRQQAFSQFTSYYLIKMSNINTCNKVSPEFRRQ